MVALSLLLRASSSGWSIGIGILSWSVEFTRIWLLEDDLSRLDQIGIDLSGLLLSQIKLLECLEEVDVS